MASGDLNWGNKANILLLSLGVSTSDTTINVTSSTSNWPAAPFMARIKEPTNFDLFEIVKVTTKNANSFVVTRAQGATSARSFGAGALIEHVVTADNLNDVPWPDQANTWTVVQTLERPQSNSPVLSSRVTNDADLRFVVDADGTMVWGAGDSVGNRDVVVRRPGANILRLEDSFEIKGPRPWIDVRAHGAVGDGVTDDLTAINAAIAALPSTGGTVFFPPGNYLISGTISIATGSAKEQFHLLGAGRKATTITCPASALGLDIGRSGANTAYWSIKGITFTRATPSSTAGTIRVTKGDQCRIDDCDIIAGLRCLQLSNCLAMVVSNCGINSAYNDGVRMDNCDQCTFVGNTFESSLTAGTHVAHINMQSGNTACVFTGNVLTTGTRALYSDGGASNDNSFVGNTARDVTHGVQLAPVSPNASNRWTITGNTFRGQSAGSSFGIRLYGANNTVTGNTVTGFTSAIEEVNGSSLASNTITGNNVDVAPVVNASTTMAAANVLGVSRLPGDLVIKGPSPWADVKAYGAKGDGTTDDTASINAAITAAPAGSTLYFPPGSYLITSAVVAINKSLHVALDRGVTITLSIADQGTGTGAINITADDVSIEGRGDTSLIQQGSNKNIQTLVQVNTQKRVTFRDFKMDGQENTQTNASGTYYTGIRSKPGSADIRFEGVHFTRAGNRAVDMRGTKRIWFERCKFTNTGVAMPGNGGGTNGGNAISCDISAGNDWCEDVTVTDCYFENVGDAAIGIPQTKRGTIKGNIILGATAVGATPIFATEVGIAINGTDDVVVEGNTIIKTNNKGIQANDKTQGGVHRPLKNARIANNTIVGATGLDTSIGVTPGANTSGNSTNIVLAGNTIDGLTMTGTLVAIGNHVRGVVVANNVLRVDAVTAAQKGINVSGSADEYSIVGNETTNLDRGIELGSTAGSNGLVAGNSIIGGGSSALNIQPTPGPLVLGNFGANVTRNVLPDSHFLQMGTTSPATAGTIRLRNNETIQARNAGNSANVALIKLNASDQVELGANDAQLVTPADGETALLVRRNVGGTLTVQRVSMGAADSGGTGFKVLRVPN